MQRCRFLNFGCVWATLARAQGQEECRGERQIVSIFFHCRSFPLFEFLPHCISSQHIVTLDFAHSPLPIKWLLTWHTLKKEPQRRTWQWIGQWAHLWGIFLIANWCRKVHPNCRHLYSWRVRKAAAGEMLLTGASEARAFLHSLYPSSCL